VAGKTEPLHRLLDSALQAANNTAAVAVCTDVWGDYSGTGQQCDEYPFATTKEGAYTGTVANGGLQRFSARLINGSDNGTAGSRLGATYSDQRVLPDDAFLVRVDA
jgi:hypothetical protein